MSDTLNLRKFLLAAMDVILLYLSLIIAVFLGFGQEFTWVIFAEHLLPFSLLYALWLIIFYIFGLYDLAIIRAKETFQTRMAGAVTSCLISGLGFFYLLPASQITPKTNLVLNILIFAGLIFIWRKTFLSLFSSRLIARVAIVGRKSQAQKLAKEISSRPYLGYKLVNLNHRKNLLKQIKEKRVDIILVPPDLVFDSQLIQNLYQCLPSGVKFLDWTRAYEIIAEKIPVAFLNHVWFLENLGEGEKLFYDKLKRFSDILLSGLIFLSTLPLWLPISLIIKLADGGSVIYTQERIGKDGRHFMLFKFRSMKPGAEKKTGPRWAKDKDKRSTLFGSFLRRMHLDELPQMVNVLKGEISLIGPRPERPNFVEQLEKEIPHYHLRHIIKPGFTGWAQIKFRYARSMMDSQEKFQYDLYYLKNRSWLLDLVILLKTLQLFFKK